MPMSVAAIRHIAAAGRHQSVDQRGMLCFRSDRAVLRRLTAGIAAFQPIMQIEP